MRFKSAEHSCDLGSRREIWRRAVGSSDCSTPNTDPTIILPGRTEATSFAWPHTEAQSQDQTNSSQSTGSTVAYAHFVSMRSFDITITAYFAWFLQLLFQTVWLDAYQRHEYLSICLLFHFCCTLNSVNMWCGHTLVDLVVLCQTGHPTAAKPFRACTYFGVNSLWWSRCQMPDISA